MSVLLQKKANQFRERNGISGGEAIHLKSLLLKLNVFTVFRPLTETFSGMSLKVNNNALFILVNSNLSTGRN